MDVQLPQPILRIVFRCSEQTKTALVAKMQIHEGSILTDELFQQARETAKAYNKLLAVLIKQSLRQEEYLKSAPEMRKMFLAPFDQGVSVVIWDRTIPPERIRRNGTEHNSRLIEKPMPTYDGGDKVSVPAVVRLAIIIGNDGSIVEIDPLAGPDALISPAVDAVRRWKYQPTLLNGRPVEVETTVEAPFPAEK